jgi:C4-dicarboxylate transporter DctM subunit
MVRHRLRDPHQVSLIAPPFGLNLLVLQRVVPNSSFSEIVIGCVPYVLILLAMIGLLAVWPEVALWLQPIKIMAAQAA